MAEPVVQRRLAELKTCGCELRRQPGIGPCSPPIPEMGQEAPVRVQHTGLAQTIDVVLRGQVMQPQAPDLAAKQRDRLTLLAHQRLHQPNRL
jgi:hypothetical protein